MLTEWDDTPWAGTESRALIVPEPPVIHVEPQKAATGPGVGFYGPGSIMMNDYTRSPQKLMLRAQQAYRHHPWVGSAEAVVTRKVTGLPWHLEDPEGEVFERGKEPPAVTEIRNVLEHPIIGGRKVGFVDLEALLSRHIGLCGMGYLYLDQRNAMNGTPLALVYVNPARVWAAETEQGALSGWVLDARDNAGNGGTPYRIDELVPFYLDQPDYGQYGIGMYERMMTLASVTMTSDQHAAYVLGTGGRIAGILAPKEGIIPDEKFLALVREMRVVNESPDAAKRTTVMQNPVEYIQTAANPSELDFIELSKLTRDDIFIGWGLPLSQVPVSAAVGMNSGDTKGWDEAVLMQGVVHDRVTTIMTTLQTSIIDLWNADVRFVIEEPEFDDDTPAYARAAQAVVLPLTNNQRLAIIGEEPLPDYDTNGEPLGAGIWMASTMTQVLEGPDENGKLATREKEPEPPPLPAIPAPGEVVPPPPPGANLPPAQKARLKPLLGLRQSVETRWIPRITSSLEEALGEQRALVVAKLQNASAETLKRHRNDPDYWLPKSEDKRLMAALLPQERAIADTVTDKVAIVLRKGKASFVDGVQRYIASRLAERVQGINDFTRQAIAAAVTRGFEDGLGPLEVAGLITEGSMFDLARADRIARTESMFAYNDAALGTYTEYGVEQVQAIDGDYDPECAERDGQVFTIDEAAGIEDHPNGTLDWVPYFPDDKARIEPSDSVKAMNAMVEFGKNIAPTFNVSAAEVEVPTPIINVQAPPAPNVYVDTSGFAEALQELKAALTMSKEIVRDENGRIVGLR